MPVCLLNLHKNGTHIPQECWRWSTWCKTNGWSEHAGELGDSLPGKTCVRGNPCLLESCKRIQITSLWLIIAYYWPSLQRLNLHIYTRGLALMLWVIYLSSHHFCIHNDGEAFYISNISYPDVHYVIRLSQQS